MKPSTLEWVEKAEEDWEAAPRMYRARKVVLSNIACFHCQQCVEKYLKAKLNEVGVYIYKTHDLDHLLQLILPTEPNWIVLQPQIVALNPYAVLYRYPGHDATKIEAKEALKNCRVVRRIIRSAFGLPV